MASPQVPVATVDLLVPTPHALRRTDGHWCVALRAPLRVAFVGSDDRRAIRLLTRALEPVDVVEVGPGDAAQVYFQVQAGPGTAAPPGSLGCQGYRLTVTPEGAHVYAATAHGAFHGACTLAQLLAVPPDATVVAEMRVPGLEIEDSPDFERRGVMLDVSRDRVPRMDTLYALIEHFARWKLNEVQLYMEHTFAYTGHEQVWRDASPFLPEELRKLTRFCAERFIDLVPNQQSLGHFHRWLIHDEYRGLAECPQGVEHPFSTSPEPFSLAPTAPASLEFVRELHTDLLQNFDSGFLNVGLDETFDIGRGASSDAVAKHGKGRVYLDYLTDINRSVVARGLRMQFWGDVILEHPELVSELPRDAVALEWGYEADHPFEEHAQRFAQAGLDFYVCPGTSSWQSFSGRLDNATHNLELAARAGRSAGACGYLITDWGDFGHWQPAPVSYAPFIAGASRAWNADAAPADLARALDQHVFGSVFGARSAGALWTAMGNLYLASGARSTNASALFLMVRFADEAWPHERVTGWTRAGMERTVTRIAELRADLEHVGTTCVDGPLVASEARWVFAALDLACELGEARLTLGRGAALSTLARPTRTRLGERLQALCSDLRPIWLARSRPGGLANSLARFEPLTRLLAGH